MRRLIIVLPVLGLFLLAACSQQANREEPPKIVYGQDVCDRCGMIVNEENYAAAYWTVEGEARRFDDVGGMLAYMSEETEDVASYWVHDLVTGDWIRAEEATFVLDHDLMTPMGFGIAAFADQDQAQALAYGREDVMVLPFSQLLAMDITMPVAHMHEEQIEGMEEMEHGE